MRNRELWSGGKIGFPAPKEQAHRKQEEFSRKQPDMGHRTTRGEAAAPLQRTTRLGSLFFSNVTGQTKLNKPLVEKVHIGYRVAGKALLKPSLSESGHSLHRTPHIGGHTPTKAARACAHSISLYIFSISSVSPQSPNLELWEGRGSGSPAGSCIPRTTEPCSGGLRIPPGSRPACFSLSCSKPGVLRKGRGNRTWGEVSHDNYCII